MRITHRALEQQLAVLEQKIISLEVELLADGAAHTSSPAASRWRRCYRQMLAIEHRLAGRILQTELRDAARSDAARSDAVRRDTTRRGASDAA